MIIMPMIFTGPTLLLTSDIIKQRLGAAALDRHVVLQECCMFVPPPPFCFNKMIPDDVIMIREAPVFPTVINGLLSSSVSMSTVCPAGWANRKTSIALFFTRPTIL